MYPVDAYHATAPASFDLIDRDLTNGGALEESAARADELAVQGDYNGAAVWRRISEAVSQLANMALAGRLRWAAKLAALG